MIDDCYLFFKNEEHLLFTKFTYFIDAYFWNSLNFESYQIGNFLVEKELLDIFQLQIPELVGFSDSSRIISNAGSGMTFIIESIIFMKVAFKI